MYIIIITKSFNGGKHKIKDYIDLILLRKKKLTPGGCLPLPRGYIHVHNQLLSNIFSETAWPINAKFYVEPSLEWRTKVYINGPGHMTKIAAMLIYGKNL